MRAPALAFLLGGLLAGCYQSHGRPVERDAGPPDAPDAGVPDAGAPDAGATDAGPGCTECLPPIAWGFAGGLFPSRVTSELTGCEGYRRSRTEPSGMIVLECDVTLACVDPDGVGVSDLAPLLADPAVREIFDAGDRTFAEGPIVADIPSFAIVHRGARVVFARDCAFEACSVVPPELEALRRALLDLDAGLPPERCIAMGGLVVRP